MTGKQVDAVMDAFGNAIFYETFIELLKRNNKEIFAFFA